MMERWHYSVRGMEPSSGPFIEGEWVRYDDAQRAIAEAEQRAVLKVGIIHASDRDAYEQGQRDERARIRAAMEAVPTIGAFADELSYVRRAAVLAVIDAGGES